MGDTENLQGRYGGTRITGCACGLTLIFGIILLFVLMIPVLAGGTIEPSEIGEPYISLVSGTCCCISFLGVIGGLVVIFLEPRDPVRRRR